MKRFAMLCVTEDSPLLPVEVEVIGKNQIRVEDHEMHLGSEYLHETAAEAVKQAITLAKGYIIELQRALADTQAELDSEIDELNRLEALK